VWVLPYIEETRMYDSFNPTSASTRFGAILTGTTGEDSTNLATQNTPLSIYKCPSDVAQRAAQPSLNYFGVQGGGADAIPPALCQNGVAPNYRLRFDNGILFTRLSTESAIRVSNVTDGLSKTFLVGEGRWWSYDYTNTFGNYFSWSSSNRVNGISGQPLVLAAAVDPLNNPLVDYDASQVWGTVASPTNAQNLGTHTRCFGSRHPGGCHMAMADGSVQFVSNSISTTLYRQLATRADGQPVGAIE
jgi:prepilin-type processing-associated H-X9-DG protein